MSATIKQALKNGDICIFETDTVVGIGCIPTSKNLNKIYEIKNRPLEKKLPWLVADLNMAYKYIKADFNDNIVKSKWPGKTTFIFNSLKGGTLALRQPATEELQKIMSEIDSPIVCTSANISGEPAVSSIKDVNSHILKSADFVYDKKLNLTQTNKSSEIIDLTKDKLVVIRP
ncbi:MAG: L-threonylcarbamoyladenylate synthase [Coriobacteriia bacterium]|nr:L-threonylcarbamoyladenylate synthase [Coriobacteriia bacterium]